MGSDSSTDRPHNLITQKVQRGPFLISLSVQGNLDSQKNATLSSQVEGSTTIISLIPEGTIVEEGDVLCELDSSSLRDKAKQQEIKVTQTEATLAQAKEALEIQKTQNESDISAATLKWQLAVLDLEKYKDGDYPQESKELSGNVALAEEELLRAEENYDFTQEQVKKGYRTQNDLEAARIAVKQAELKLQGAKEKLKVLTKYTYNRTIAELEENSREFQRELKRTELKAKANLTQAEKDVEALELTYDVEKEQYERMLAQIDACTLKAPQPGEVVYANMSSSRRSSEPTAIEEGATVRERQAIINLPDVTQMKVDCRIHESLIGSIRTGLSAQIRIDAYPDQVFNGEVADVSSVPMSGKWPNTDLREYQTSIHLTDEVEIIRKLRPGLTAQVVIEVDNRADVLQVPVQAVVTVVNQQIAYVLKNGEAEQRKLQVGQSNQTHIEVLDGLEEGDVVILNPRSQFGEAIAELEGLLNTEKKNNDADAAAKRQRPPAANQAPGPPRGKKPKKEAAASGGGSSDGFFARFDTNKDGQLTKEELPERMQSRFSELDTDSSGAVSTAEFAAGAKNMQRPAQ